jgi:hypothetical protein
VFDVFRESDPVADCQRDLLSLEHTELPYLVEWRLLLDAVLTDDDSFPFQSSRERITGQLPGAQLRNQRLRRSVGLHTAATKSAKKVMKYGKSTSNSGQVGRIGQKQPEK